jgi:hypothetical protein
VLLETFKLYFKKEKNQIGERKKKFKAYVERITKTIREIYDLDSAHKLASGLSLEMHKSFKKF